MLDHLVARSPKAHTIQPLSTKGLEAWSKAQPASVQNWIKASGFKGKPGSFLLLPDAVSFLAGVEEGIDRWSLANLPATLPAGTYQLIEDDLSPAQASAHAFAWAMGCYRFARYRSDTKTFASLVWPQGADRAAVERSVRAIGLGRDLINTPAEHMGPADLAKAVEKVARAHKARFSVIVGDQLLKQNYPTIHAVGRAAAADRQPRLIDLTWKGPGGDKGPYLVLVGKGVCFDTGGLDIKPRGGMMMMKKDMGGAASVLALAQMIMEAKLPLRLRLMIPAVENSVSGASIRPLDVVKTRKGITVEINDTDAEGRLILADALADADTQKPDLMIDMATLTGAARVALGPDVPALFANDDETAEDLLRHARAEGDPLWRLPLWKPYRRMLDSKVADIANCEPGSFGGAITAALYLAEFVSEKTKWLHIDTYGWTSGLGAGRPEGGEPLGIRGLFAFIDDWLRRATKSPLLPSRAAPRAKPGVRAAAKRALPRPRPRR
ncbi:leucyl aminopeptidase family protein [Dongia rigui]|uniref:Leucyl aminopeptidase family protein n=1 Tax=Dongia rigui TaxID=940149 RepID=A0ABU5E0L8_9PROT|nr:leucyl aminopeptidase family protein [Dongia rigui]MDY0872356.1 leucyl aminopeptidase family protein [Dongia rigui]